MAYLARVITDATCSPYAQVCKSGSDLLSHIVAVVFCFLVIVAVTKGKQISDFVKRLKALFDAANSGPPAGKAKVD